MVPAPLTVTAKRSPSAEPIVGTVRFMYAITASLFLKASEVKRPTPGPTCCRSGGVKFLPQTLFEPTSTHDSVLALQPVQPVPAVRHAGPVPGSAQMPLHASQMGG